MSISALLRFKRRQFPVLCLLWGLDNIIYKMQTELRFKKATRERTFENWGSLGESSANVKNSISWIFEDGKELDIVLKQIFPLKTGRLTVVVFPFLMFDSALFQITVLLILFASFRSLLCFRLECQVAVTSHFMFDFFLNPYLKAS